MSHRKACAVICNPRFFTLLDCKQLCAISKVVAYRDLTIQNCQNKSGKSHSAEYFPSSKLHPLSTGAGGSFKLKFTDQVAQILYNMKQFYDDFTGNGAVKISQNNVTDLQSKLSVLMEKRNTTEFKLIDVKRKVADVHVAQHQVNREDSNYFELIRAEFLLTSEVQNLQNTMEILTYEHQVLLLQLTHALSDVHAKERHEVNNTRVLKLILTIVIGVAGFAGNTVYHHYKDAEVQGHMATQTVLLKKVFELMESEESRKVAKEPSESWGSYLHRQPGRFYRVWVPKKA